MIPSILSSPLVVWFLGRKLARGSFDGLDLFPAQVLEFLIRLFNLSKKIRDLNNFKIQIIIKTYEKNIPLFLTKWNKSEFFWTSN